MTCVGGPHARKYHMAVNHREVGNNFIFQAAQEYHDYLTSLLTLAPLMNATEMNSTYQPIEFKGYTELLPLLPSPTKNTSGEKALL